MLPVADYFAQGDNKEGKKERRPELLRFQSLGV